MSAICGIVSSDGRPVPRVHVERMVRAAPHRGTSGTILWTGPGGVLAQQQRTNTVTAAWLQTQADGIVVVADARIDNVPELRRGLSRSGHLDPASADVTQILRAAYEAWGDGCAGRIIGDFCFVVWDPRRRTVLAARDPLAMRNLYYRRDPSGRLLFATEVKQLLAAPGVPVEVEETAVAADLTGRFGSPGVSFYRGIDQLSPGCTLFVREGRAEVRRHWDIDPGHRLDCDFDESAEELRRVFTAAVADRLDPAAPTGILLSGGVDSGSVASVAGAVVEHEPGRTPALHAFSWGFEQLSQCDERHVSRHIVERYGMRSTDVPADPAGTLACYPEHAPDRDDPFLGAFQPLIEHSLYAARGHGVGVLLGGDRGDLVVGSTGFSYLRLLEAGHGSTLVGALREHRHALGDPWWVIARRHAFEALAGRLRKRNAAEWARWAVRRARGSDRTSSATPPPDWLRPSFLQRVDLQNTAASPPAGLGHARGLRYEHIFTPLHLRGVAWSERTYARHGLGFADPFSDRRLVELAVALPQVAINRPGDLTKPLMREAVRGTMPEKARRNADKIYPTPLYHQSLRQRAELVRSLLSGSQLEARGWVDAQLLRQHFEQWLSGDRLRPEFWSALSVEIWLRAHHP